jgi:hypothetical protein
VSERRRVEEAACADLPRAAVLYGLAAGGPGMRVILPFPADRRPEGAA